MLAPRGLVSTTARSEGAEWHRRERGRPVLTALSSDEHLSMASGCDLMALLRLILKFVVELCIFYHCLSFESLTLL